MFFAYINVLTKSNLLGFANSIDFNFRVF